MVMFPTLRDQAIVILPTLPDQVMVIFPTLPDQAMVVFPTLRDHSMQNLSYTVIFFILHAPTPPPSRRRNFPTRGNLL